MRRALHLAAALCLVAPARAAVDQRCTISVMNQSVQANPDGSFALPGIAVDARLHRARAVCPRTDGGTDEGQSDFVRMTRGRTTVRRVDLTHQDPSPVAVVVTAPRTALDADHPSTPLTTSCRFATERTVTCTHAVDGTSYTASNAAVCTVTDDGVVTAVASGGCIVTAVNQGVVGTIVLAVTLGGDADHDGLPDDFERRHDCLAAGAPDADADPDGDGLTNAQELTLGTDPCVADTDGDGADDRQEVGLGTNPLAPDSDLDGLVDGAEIRLGTNPLLADTDGDGLPDGFEVRAHCVSPLKKSSNGTTADGDVDCDGDGLLNRDERDAFTDPGNPDTDGDGLTDGFEVGFGFDPLTPGEEHQDPDGDGLDNLAEQAAGSNPRIADTDGDGLPDGQEVNVLHTSPTNRDTDGDGLTDDREVALHTNPLVADTDGGGRTDGQEVLVDGTNPLDPSDDVKSTPATPVANGPDRTAQPAVAADGAGNLHVVWTEDSGSGLQTVVYSMLSPAGATLIDDTVLTPVDGQTQAQAPAIAVDGAGHLHLVWQQTHPVTGDFEIMHAVLDPTRAARDGSASTADALALVPAHFISTVDTNDSTRAQVAVDRQGRVHVVWADRGAARIRYAQLALDGHTVLAERQLMFAPATLSGSAGREGALLPRLAIDANDDVHLVWTAILGTTTYEVFYTMLDGRTGAPRIGRTVVSDATTATSGGTAEFPSIGITANGDVMLLHESPGRSVTGGFGDLVFNRFSPAADDQDGGPANVDQLGDVRDQPVNLVARIDMTRPVAAIAPSGRAVVTSFNVDSDDGPGVLDVSVVDGTGSTLLPPRLLSHLAQDFFDDLGLPGLTIDGPTTWVAWSEGDPSDFQGKGLVVVQALDRDTDRDGLSDADEVLAGTDPSNPDTDGDGLRDGFEVRNGFDPLHPGEEHQDPDGDGLDNLAEQAAGTDPTKADTDGDGLTDSDELARGTDPTHADTDRDRLPDGQEVALGTSPTNPDTDGDGLTDGFEVKYGFDPLVGGDGDKDTDGDGLDNRTEERLNTNPLRSDTDGDGLSDGDEVAHGTSPTDPDTDGDGLSDGLEVRLAPCVDALNPLTDKQSGVPDAERDCDGDGLSNIRELQLGTDPGNADTDGDGTPDGIEVRFGCPPTAPDVTTAVAHTVDGGGAPVPGAVVRVHGITATADAQGTVQVPGVPACLPRQIRMVADAGPPGARLHGVSAAAPPVRGGVTDVGTITLTPRAPGAPYPAARFAPGESQILDLAVTDVSGDGIPDLVVLRSLAPLDVALGRGDGTFADPVSIAVGDQPLALVVDDVDGNGVPDLVVLALSNSGGSTLAVALGTGGGAFAEPTLVPLAPRLSTLTAADFDRDGKLDLVASGASLTPAQVLLLRGRGDGSFDAPVSIALGVTFGLSPTAVLATVLDGEDALVDLVLVRQLQGFNQGFVEVLRGRGDGTFDGDVDVESLTVNAPPRITMADLDGNGVRDIVVESGTAPIPVLLLPDRTAVRAGDLKQQFITAVAVADFDLDGVPDVGVSTTFGNVSTLAGLGDGTLGGIRQVLPGEGGRALAAVDVDGDEVPDLVLGSTGTGSDVTDVVVLRGFGDGTFETPIRSDVDPHVNVLANVLAGDFDHDGRDDAVVVDEQDPHSQLRLVHSSGDGRMTAAAAVAIGTSEGAAATGDIDGDGNLDVAVVSDNDVALLFGDGADGFRVEHVTAGQAPRRLVLADVDGDHHLDLLAADFGTSPLPVVVALGNGDGTFRDGTPVTVTTGPNAMAVVDVTGDGLPDLVVVRGFASTPDVAVFPGDGHGGFGAEQSLDAGPRPVALAVADVDGDGIVDLLLANEDDSGNGGPGDGTLAVLLGTGDGAFAPARFLPGPQFPDTVVVADATLDGIPDVIVSTRTSTFSVYPGRHGDVPAAPFTFTASEESHLTVADVDGDGAPDLVGITENAVAVHRHR